MIIEIITLQTGSLGFSSGLNTKFMGFSYQYPYYQDILTTNLDPLCISSLEREDHFLRRNIGTMLHQ